MEWSFDFDSLTTIRDCFSAEIHRSVSIRWIMNDWPFSVKIWPEDIRTQTLYPLPRCYLWRLKRTFVSSVEINGSWAFRAKRELPSTLLDPTGLALTWESCTDAFVNLNWKAVMPCHLTFSHISWSKALEHKGPWPRAYNWDVLSHFELLGSLFQPAQ